MAERWRAYLVRCTDGSLYCGASNDVERRFAAHRAGTGARYTRTRGAVELVWRSSPLEKRLALSLEARIKRLDRNAKLLIAERRGAFLIRRLLAAGRQALSRAVRSAQRS